MHFKCDVNKKKGKRKEDDASGASLRDTTSEVGTSAIFTLPIKVTLKLKGLLPFSSRSTKRSRCNGCDGVQSGSSVMALHLFSGPQVEAKLSC